MVYIDHQVFFFQVFDLSKTFFFYKYCNYVAPSRGLTIDIAKGGAHRQSGLSSCGWLSHHQV